MRTKKMTNNIEDIKELLELNKNSKALKAMPKFVQVFVLEGRL